MDFEQRKTILEEAMAKVKSYPKELQEEALKFLLQSTPKSNSSTRRKPAKKRGSKKGVKVSGIGLQIKKLIEDGYFQSPRSMKDISGQLAQKGFNIKLPYISPQLLKYVRKNELGRHKDSKGRYVYYKPDDGNN